MNPAFYIKNWNAEGAKIFVNGKEFKKCEVGVNQRLDGTDLAVFIWIENESRMSVTIHPE